MAITTAFRRRYGRLANAWMKQIWPFLKLVAKDGVIDCCGIEQTFIAG
jgi:hypothetical protein